MGEKFVTADDSKRKQKHLMRKPNQKGYRDLQLAATKLSFQLETLAKTVQLPNGSLAKAWAGLKDEYDLSEGEDKIKIMASLSTQVMKLNRLHHSISDDYLMTHILAGLPPEIQFCGRPCQD